jgi:hypothetical protein
MILSNITITINIIFFLKTQRIKIDHCLKKYNQHIATGTHVKIHVSALLIGQK